MEAGEVAPDIQGADAETVPAVRLGEVPARVVDDIPSDAGFLHIVRQQGLRKIVWFKLFAGALLNMSARGIHDLPGVGWQRAVAARVPEGLFHDLRGRLFELDSALSRHPLCPVGPRGGTTLLRLPGPGPLLRASPNGADACVRHVARPVLSIFF